MPKDFVVDASIVMSWCFKDEANRYTDAILDILTEATAYVPSVWPLEIGNVILVAERRKRLNKADSTRFLGLLAELPIVITPEPPGRMMNEILVLAREQKLSTYDASYLDLAMRMGLPLATLDRELSAAARRTHTPTVGV